MSYKKHFTNWNGMDVVLSILVWDEKTNEKEMAFVVDGEWHENLTFHYTSSDGGKQIARHIHHLMKKCSSVEELEDMVYSEEWVEKFMQWSRM